MQIGMIGLGRMGANMARRLQRTGHHCVVFDRNADSVKEVARDGATAATSLDDLVKKLQRPRAVWLMVPAAVVDATLQDRAAKLDAGHFVKRVHNEIEYALMAAYAEGLNILKHANAGSGTREVDAETSPLRNPENYRYDFPLADVTEVWRRGSVVASWLLDLTAISLLEQPSLEKFSGRVSDSGEGRWTILAALESSAPAPVLSASLFQRFVSRGEDDFADKLLSAMLFQFGGHMEKAAAAKQTTRWKDEMPVRRNMPEMLQEQGQQDNPWLVVIFEA